MSPLPTLALMGLFLLYGFTEVCSQPPVQWSRFYGNAGGASAVKTTPVPGGGYIVVGQVYAGGGQVSGYHGAEDIWLLKLDASGNMEWNRCLGGSGSDVLSTMGGGGEVRVTSDGGYIVTGFSNSTDGDVQPTIEGNHGGLDGWVVKLDAGGGIQWQRSLGGSGDEIDFSVRETPEGRFLVVGHTLSNDGNVSGNHGARDVWAVMLSADGRQILWQRCLGSSSFDYGNKIEPAPDGGYLIGSSTRGNDGDVSGNHSDNFDMWLVKLNAAGALVWQKCYGGRWNEEMSCVRATPDGGYILGGFAGSWDGDVTTNKGQSDYWLVKTDGLGNLQWQKTFGSFNFEFPGHLCVLPTGEILFTGATETGVDNGDVQGARGSADGWTIMVSASGNLVWQKVLGGTQWDYLSSVYLDTDGGLVLSGETTSVDGDGEGNPFPLALWVVKLAPPVPLPVQFVRFTGFEKGDGNLLQWTTARERDNSHFVVERSLDGVTFQSIATVQGKGSAGSQATYEYLDRQEVSHLPDAYYRLAQVDPGGTRTYSGVVRIQREHPAWALKGWQAANGSFVLMLTTEQEDVLQVTLYDAAGRQLRKQAFQAQRGTNRFTASIAELPAGVYFLEAKGRSKQKQTFKLLR